MSNRTTESNVAGPSGSESLPVIEPKSKKRKTAELERIILEDNKERKEIDKLLLETLANSNQDEENEDSLFCRSLIKSFSKMTPKSSRLAKIEIQQVLLKYEFEE